MKYKSNAKSLARSFGYALQGLWYTITHERNMRVHIVAAIYVLLFSTFYEFNDLERVVLCAVICFVIIAELFNTAIEALVNLISPQYDNYAKIAKDTAAAAVFVTAAFAVAAGIWLFGDIAVYKKIFGCFSANISLLVLFVLSLVFSFLFIFSDNKK